MANRVSGFAHRRLSATTSSTPAFILVIALFAFAMAATAILLAYRVTMATGSLARRPRTAPMDDARQFNACIDGTLKTVKVSNLDVASYETIWRLCGEQLYDIDALNDFDIRKEKFIRQELDERVILFLVVAITVSGVALAGLQLLASYKLASLHRVKFTEDSTLSLERDKVSLRSSVTGLMILVVSLVFFTIYVKWVYTIKEIGIEPQLNEGPPPNNFNPAGHALLNVNGGLGAPPTLAPKAAPGAPDAASSAAHPVNPVGANPTGHVIGNGNR